MPTRAGRGYTYRGAPQEISTPEDYIVPSGNPPFLASDAMFKIFDAPALEDIKRRLNMVAAGMSLESAFPANSPQMQSFQKYYGTMPAPTTTMTPAEVTGYDEAGAPVMKPGSTFTSPGLFPGGVPTWATQQIAKGGKIPEELAAATGMLKTPTASQVLAPAATAGLQQLKNDSRAQDQYRGLLRNIRDDRPTANEDALNREVQWNLNQRTNGRLFPGVERPTEDELGPSKQQSKQTHEELQLAEKNARIDTRQERKIEAQAARQKAINDLQREIASQKDVTKRRGQDITSSTQRDIAGQRVATQMRGQNIQLQKIRQDYEHDKIKIFSRVSSELEDVLGPEDAFKIAKDLASGKSIADLDLSPTAQAFIARSINKSDEWHAAKVAKANRVEEGKGVATDLKIANMELKLLDSMMRFEKLAQMDPDIKKKQADLRLLVQEGHLLERIGDRNGALAVAKHISEQFGLEDVGQPGMFGKMMNVLSGKPPVEAGPVTVAPQPYTPPPAISEGLRGVRDRIDNLRNPNPNVIPAPQAPRPGPVSPAPAPQFAPPPISQPAPVQPRLPQPGAISIPQGSGGGMPVRTADEWKKAMEDKRRRGGRP